MNLNKKILLENVLNLIYGWRNKKNSKWIKKYINILSDSSNENAKKFEKHHIIPCFSFKDETHKNRSQTEPLANKIEGNLIKLSYYNHIIAHYCLWKIFDTWESRNVVQQRCGTKDIETLSESQIKKIAKIQEECAKENMTEEEYREHAKKYREENREELNEKSKEWYHANKDEINERRKCYEENKDKILENNRIYREENKEEIYSHSHLLCYDPKKDNFCTLQALYTRKYRNKELYKDVIPSECIVNEEVNTNEEK